MPPVSPLVGFQSHLQEEGFRVYNSRVLGFAVFHSAAGYYTIPLLCNFCVNQQFILDIMHHLIDTLPQLSP